MKSVLIVEDDREIRKLLADYLTGKDFEVSEAGDGRSALIAMKDKVYDVILMDMMLPYNSGSELIAALRGAKKDSAKAHTPVIVISAKSGLDTRIETLHLGADRSTALIEEGQCKRAYSRDRDIGKERSGHKDRDDAAGSG